MVFTPLNERPEYYRGKGVSVDTSYRLRVEKRKTTPSISKRPSKKAQKRNRLWGGGKRQVYILLAYNVQINANKFVDGLTGMHILCAGQRIWVSRVVEKM